MRQWPTRRLPISAAHRSFVQPNTRSLDQGRGANYTRRPHVGYDHGGRLTGDRTGSFDARRLGQHRRHPARCCKPGNQAQPHASSMLLGGNDGKNLSTTAERAAAPYSVREPARRLLGSRRVRWQSWSPIRGLNGSAKRIPMSSATQPLHRPRPGCCRGGGSGCCGRRPSDAFATDGGQLTAMGNSVGVSV